VLGKIGPEAKQAIPDLVRALAKGVRSVYFSNASTALERICPEAKDVISVFGNVVADWNSDFRKAAAALLDKIYPGWKQCSKTKQTEILNYIETAWSQCVSCGKRGRDVVMCNVYSERTGECLAGTGPFCSKCRGERGL